MLSDVVNLHLYPKESQTFAFYYFLFTEIKQTKERKKLSSFMWIERVLALGPPP